MLKNSKKIIASILVAGTLMLGIISPSFATAASATVKTFGTQYADVNGDGALEKVFFSAKASDYLYENVYVNVQTKNGKKNLAKFYVSDYANTAGNSLSFGDVDGDKTKDILAVLYVGGTDGAHECGIFTLKGNKPKTLKLPTNATWNSTLSHVNNKYLVKFTTSFTKKTYTIDITDNYNIKRFQEEFNMKYEINQDGRGPYYLIKDIDKDGKMELGINGECDGMNHADYLASVTIFYKYDKSGKWTAKDYTLESGYPIVE